MLSRFAKKWWLAPLVATILVAALLAAAQFIGMSSRSYLPEQQAATVRGPGEAYQSLRQAGLHGRIVVILDKQTDIVPRLYDREFMASLAASGTSAPFQPLNLASGLIETGIARTVYFVPPPSLRAAISQRLGSRWDAKTEPSGFSVRFNGAPVHVVLGDLNPSDFGEKVVVYANRDVLTDYDASLLTSLESTAVSDVLVIQDTP